MSKKKHHARWLIWLKNRLFPKPDSLEELHAYLAHCEQVSIINHDTCTILESVLAFSHMHVRDTLIPKNQMISISQEATLPEIIQIVTESGHSRFPVTGETNDEIIGILHAKDLLRFRTSPDSFDLYDLLRQAFFVPESKRLLTLLSDFRKTRNHMAIVVDEYGAVGGLITLEDIVEQIIGEIEDEFDTDEEMLIKCHGQGRYTIKGHTPIELFNEELHANFSDELFDTIAGIVSGAFAHVPKRGETIQLDGFHFKVLHADSRRILMLECLDGRTAA